ncbi:MAG TPA: trypsin-like peptidase domain-containing protein [Roseiarcus sp.]
MTIATRVLGVGCSALVIALTPVPARAQTDRADLTALAVHINRTPQQSWPGYGVYLGNGLVLTAAHVAGEVAETKPRVVIGGQDLPATLVKQGSLDGVDLTLLSVDGTKLPVSLQMRRTPLCKHPPFAGERVVVAIPEKTAPSRVLPRQAIPADVRGRFDTTIADVATTGNSGSGVFDAGDLCLLGIVSRKISVTSRPFIIGAPAHTVDIAKYFVPAAQIKAFIPANVSF